MKGSMMWRLMYVFCALAGCLAGFGVFRMTGIDDVEPNIVTEDSTLVRESENGVFFDGEKNPAISTENTVTPVLPAALSSAPEPEDAGKPTPVVEVSEIKEMAAEVQEQLVQEDSAQKTAVGQAAVTMAPDVMPSLGSQWAVAMPEVIPTPVPVITPMLDVEKENEQVPQNSAEEVLTYPAKIFGQTPVINRSDAYVSYFEFAYDLIEMLEPEVIERGLNLNVLLTKFVIKALFYGVDIEKLDINAPIPRRLAALCLWLAGQLLQESGCDTSAKTAQNYVTDIGGCSSAEKKAVAYLYEQGIISGYQVAGQVFYPNDGLKTEAGSAWLSRVKQCWN